MADAILSNVSNDQTNPNPATEAKPTTPPKGIPFPKAQHRTERPIDLKTVESIVAKIIGYRVLEGKSLEDAKAAGLTKARELVNDWTRQDAKKAGNFREVANFLVVWAEQIGIEQIRDCVLANQGRLIDLEPFHKSVARFASIIKEVSSVETALEFVGQAEDVRHGKDGHRMLDPDKRKIIVKSLVS